MMEKTIRPEIFKAYDIRGKVGEELYPEVCLRIGRAFADWLPTEGAVAVGHDMRADSYQLAQSVMQGLREQGRDVVDIGRVATDMIYFTVGKYQLAGGVVVTASHNPGEYNGIKLCRELAKPVGLESGLDEIRDAVIANTFVPSREQGSITEKNVDKAWIEHVLSFVDRENLTPLHLGVDAGNGMMGKIFPILEPFVPWKIEELYFELDGTFPNHEANPLKFETLHDLIERIKADHLDGGIAFDGDGDRAFLVDETGVVLSGGVMSSMLAEYFLQKYPGSAIVYDARNSKAVPEIISELGGRAVKSKVGHSNLKHAAREEDAPFAGEASGHFFFKDNWFADSGLIAVVIGLGIVGSTGGTLSELRKKYERYPAIPETNFVVEDKEATMQRVAKEFTDGDQDWFDGLTVRYKDKWFNLRPSNTESLLRLNAEAATPEELDKFVDKITTYIKA